MDKPKPKHFFQIPRSKLSDYKLPPPIINDEVDEVKEASKRGARMLAIHEANNAPKFPEKKKCSSGRGCGETISRHEFSSDPGSKDLRSDICKKCSARLGRESRARKKAKKVVE